MFRKQYVLLGAAALVAATATGCSHGQSASSGHPMVTSTAVAPAVAKAKAQISGCVNKTGVTNLAKPSGRTAVIDCVKSLVPPAKQGQLKDCITKAAKNDKIWTQDGRSKFLSVDGPNCVNAAS